MCFLQLLFIVIGLLLLSLGVVLVIKKFNDNTHGSIKVFGIEASGPSKLIILGIGTGLVIFGAKIECPIKNGTAKKM